MGGQYAEKIPKRHWTDEETFDGLVRIADRVVHAKLEESKHAARAEPPVVDADETTVTF